VAPIAPSSSAPRRIWSGVDGRSCAYPGSPNRSDVWAGRIAGSPGSHPYRGPVTEPAGSQLNRTQPTCRRSAQTGPAQPEPAGGGASASRMLLDTSIRTACSRPTTVHSSSVSGAPGVRPSPGSVPPDTGGAQSALACREEASSTQSRAFTSAPPTTRSGPVTHRSRVTVANGCRTIRLARPACFGWPSAVRASPGTSVQCRSTRWRGSSPGCSSSTSGAPAMVSPSSTTVAPAPMASTIGVLAASTGRCRFADRTVTVAPAAAVTFGAPSGYVQLSAISTTPPSCAPLSAACRPASATVAVAAPAGSPRSNPPAPTGTAEP
jgi:hypothetical protein